MPGETHLVGYTDVIIVLIAVRTNVFTQLKLNQVLHYNNRWVNAKSWLVTRTRQRL